VVCVVGPVCERWLQDGDTPPPMHKKQHRVRRPKIDENLAERPTHPDSRVPVVNNDGQILTGDDAPLLRELDMWLEEHPTFTPLSEVRIIRPLLLLFSSKIQSINQPVSQAYFKMWQHECWIEAGCSNLLTVHIHR